MLDRRRTLALGAAAALAGCVRPLMTPSHARPVDRARMAQGFPALARRALPGVLGLAVSAIDDGQRGWSSDQLRTWPLAGAAAAPIAATALAQIDAGELSLTQPVGIAADDLSPPPSLIDQRWPDPPQGHAETIPLQSLFDLALRQGDDTAIDLLLKAVGGPGAVTAFLEARQVTGLTVDRYQREIIVALSGMPTFRPAWKTPAAFDAAHDAIPAPARRAAMRAFIADARDSATAPAALGFLDSLVGGELVSPASTARLLGWMQRTPGSRLRPGLPASVRLAVAVGATPTDLGETAATTELAVATWPDGYRYALAAFLVGSTADAAARGALFADAARLVAAAIGGV